MSDKSGPSVRLEDTKPNRLFLKLTIDQTCYVTWPENKWDNKFDKSITAVVSSELLL